ncbi:cation diffusion facilitator family transporter [Candidatus Ichthyocystis hellenicum]|uniref:cation diffusion facilitator family transporter n=1 Tax=Candidatus Ichthyocystis hellenicum TaxID=1561003 RepID=UPI000AD2AE8E|nr:cation diffusion facilitator family transporter [Candidatus Ichthyocystis hellenicum]
MTRIHHHGSVRSDSSEAKIKERREANKSVIVSAVVNIILACVQILSGSLYNSSGLIADGFHTISDSFSDCVVIVASIFSNRKADDDHQYGHYRYENAATFVLGISLFVVGSLIIWSSVKNINGHATKSVGISALWISLSIIVIKEALFRYMMHTAKKVNSSMLAANAWHARSDALSSLIVSLGIIGNIYGYKFLDPLAGIVVGLLIAKMGASFSYESFNDLTDHATSVETYEKIDKIIRTTPGVIGCHDIKTRIMGSMIVVDVHIEVDGDISVKEGHDIAVEARRRVTEQLPVLNVMTHIDPV